MNESEKVENNVNAKEIRDKLLKALHLGPGELATALGVNYQRVYDLGSGRTKKFNPGMVNLIVSKFPQVNATFLYTGKGEPLKVGASVAASPSDVSEIISMSRQLRYDGEADGKIGNARPTDTPIGSEGARAKRPRAQSHRKGESFGKTRVRNCRTLHIIYMWNNEAEKCFSYCVGSDYCKSFDHCRGWGCRLLRHIPSAFPRTEMEKAEIFSDVYSKAEQLGVIRCKNFNPLRIDEVLDDDVQLRLIIGLEDA